MKKFFRTLFFWILSLTWGLPATIVGFLAATVLILTGHKPKNYHGNVMFIRPADVGSLNLGPFFFVSRRAQDDAYTKYHEAGHGLQNILYGPIYLIIVGLFSIIWYHIFRRKYKDILPTLSREEKDALYEKLWCEKQASKWGKRVYFDPYQKPADETAIAS